MSTPDPKGGSGGISPPGELRPYTSQLPRSAQVTEASGPPAVASSTPGASLAGARFPGGPVLPDMDPISLTNVLSQIANEMFRAPPMFDAPESDADLPAYASASTPAVPAAAIPSPAGSVAPQVTTAAPPTPPRGSVPTEATAPTVTAMPSSVPPVPASPASTTEPSLPASPVVAAPTTAMPSGEAGVSPFDAPLDFTRLGAFSDPFGIIDVAGELPLGLVDAPVVPPPTVVTTAAPAPAGVPTSGVPATHAPSPAVTEPPHDARIAYDSAQLFAPTVTPAIREPERRPFDPHLLKREFPILDEQVRGRRLVWLDNAATTQKPRAVIDRISYFYEHENSNIHRAAHTLAARVTDAYEAARESVRRFINAPSTKNIVFVRGTTEGINLIAHSWGRRRLESGDEIILTNLEHHANIVPWQLVCEATGARIRVAPVDDRGQIMLDKYELLFTSRTKLVSFTQVSNALGTITPAREMIEIAHRHGVTTVLDGAQAVSHMPVDVQQLDCDFFVFSGHKMFGPTGIGAVYGKSEVLDSMVPYQGGGNMIADVTFERTVYQPPPMRFEAGTGNIADAVGLGAAADWLLRLGLPMVASYEHELLEYGTELLRHVPGLTMIGTAADKAGVLSFILDGQKTEEVGGMLDQEGIAVRSGHHCAQPILRRFGVEATVRASLAPYNTREDLEALAAALHRIQAGRRSR